MPVKFSGMGLIGTVAACLMLLIALGSGFYLGSHVVRDYKTQAIMRECDVIDSALSRYSLSHINLQPDTVTYSGTSTVISYTKDRSYPASLADLGVLRDEQGYFADVIDLSKFDYAVSVDATTHVATYTLGVTLPNGFYYVSPLSGK